jgi:hypothetical protein
MPVDVLTEIAINRPRDEVAAFAADPAEATAWYQNIKTVAWETPPPAVVGSRIRFHARFLGRSLDYTYEVLEVEPGRRFVMATAQGPFPMKTTYAWEDLPSGATKMTLRNTGEPSRFAVVAAPVMTRAMRKANEADLRRLKALLERWPGGRHRRIAEPVTGVALHAIRQRQDLELGADQGGGI